MSNTALVRPPANDIDFAALESVLALGDLSKLTAKSRVDYYRGLCESLGLNSLSRPFDYISLQGKLTLYAKKDCTDQLRRIYNVSVDDLHEEVRDGLLIVKALVSMPSGRKDADFGAVPFENLKGEARANAMLKCVTKAKRRATLSICGLGMLDESEVDSVQGARRVKVDHETGEILDHVPEACPSVASVPAPSVEQIALEYSTMRSGVTTYEAAKKLYGKAMRDKRLPKGEQRDLLLQAIEKLGVKLRDEEMAAAADAVDRGMDRGFEEQEPAGVSR